MLSFNETDFWRLEKGALGLRPQIEKAIDDICAKGYSNILYIAIGGTWAHALQIKSIVETHSNIPLIIINAGDFIHQNTPQLTKDSLVFMESVSGDTQELVKAAEIVKNIGCRSFGFVDDADSPLASMLDVCISFEAGVFYKLFYTFFRLMYHAGDFPEYQKLCSDMERLPEVIYAAKEQFDPIAQQFAKEYGDEPFLYLAGAGYTYGGVYSYAMCVLEEMQWIKTKSIFGPEFFHGTLEIIDREVPLVLYKGEDYSRAIMDRLENFANRISRKVFVIDLAEYTLEGISKENREYMGPFLVQALNERISKHLEYERRHPLDIRRYYRRLKY